MKPEELVEGLEKIQSGIRTFGEALGASSYVNQALDSVMGTTIYLIKAIPDLIGFHKGDLVYLNRNYTFPQHFERGVSGDRAEHGWWYMRETFKAGTVAKVHSIDVCAWDDKGHVNVFVTFPRVLAERDFPGPKHIVPEKDNPYVWRFSPEYLNHASQEMFYAWIEDFDMKHFPNPESALEAL